MKERKALILRTISEDLEELNSYLAEGWVPISIAGCGNQYNGYFLVILEREE